MSQLPDRLANLVDVATKFLDKVIEPPLEEVGGLMADTVKYWRYKNQVNIILKAKAFLEAKGVEPRTVPLKTLVPLLEHCSWEENSNLQEKWAALLANAADSTLEREIRASYGEILKQLSPKEATLLDELYDEHLTSPAEGQSSLQFDKNLICQSFNISSEQFDVMVDNLFRLNLLQPPASHGGVSIGDYPIVLRTYDVVQLTALGCDFIESCRFHVK